MLEAEVLLEAAECAVHFAAPFVGALKTSLDIFSDSSSALRSSYDLNVILAGIDFLEGSLRGVTSTSRVATLSRSRLSCFCNSRLRRESPYAAAYDSIYLLKASKEGCMRAGKSAVLLFAMSCQ